MVRYLDGDEFQFGAAAQFTFGGMAGGALIGSDRGRVVRAATAAMEGNFRFVDFEPGSFRLRAGRKRLECEVQGINNDPRKGAHSHRHGADFGAVGSGNGVIQQIRHQSQFMHTNGNPTTEMPVLGVKMRMDPHLSKGPVDKLFMSGGGLELWIIATY